MFKRRGITKKVFVITALLIKMQKEYSPSTNQQNNNTSHNEQDKEPQTQHKKNLRFSVFL